MDSVFERRRVDRWLIWLTVVGVALRVWQYVGNPSLWMDELLLTRNILDRSSWALMAGPLADYQVAPRGFLLTEKVVLAALGPSEYGLRLFPFLCSVVGLIAFWRVARRVLDGFAPAIALALFATAAPLIAYTSQVKQYSTDVAVAVLLLWLALGLEGSAVSTRRALWSGFAGMIAVWFSQPAVFVLAGLGASLALRAWPHRSSADGRRLAALGPTLALWSASALASILAGLAGTGPATRDALRQYWAAGFPPAPPGLALEMRWPFHQVKDLLGSGWASSLGYLYPGIFVAFILVGYLVLWRRRPGATMLIVAPVGVALAAAAANQYPFSDRLILFLVPGFLLAIAAGIEWIRERASSILGGFGLIVALPPIALALIPVLTTLPVYQFENVKPVLSHLQARWRSDDRLYVYYAARPAMSFYGTRYRFSENDYVSGGCHRGASRHYFEELDAFRGQPRVWVLVTHALATYRERDDILRYLDAIGVRRDAFTIEPHTAIPNYSLPAEVFLYDLSDPGRLLTATAGAFPVLGPETPSAQSAC
jgi:hypothetical protein